MLIVGSVSSTVTGLASAKIYDPATGRFSPTGSMAHDRSEHTATLLKNGRVLVAGGNDSSGTALASAEIYDPATGRFSRTGSMGQARTDFTANRLQDGQVLVAGGFVTTDEPLTSAELYDPATGRFSATGSMSQARYGATATLLRDGRVMVVGGNEGSPGNYAAIDAVELYDPASRSFVQGARTMVPRESHTETLLSDGRVLVAGGTNYSGEAITSSEVFDPGTGGFVRSGELTHANSANASATLLPDGRVLLAGGSAGESGVRATAELWVP